MSARKVLLIGGAGAFGSRLADGIAATTTLPLAIAGRDGPRIEAAAAALRTRYPDRDISALTLDARSLTADDLRRAKVWLVADAAGPFQGRSYQLARAAMEVGAHYLDLADGRDFVAGFTALDAEARDAGVLALTGASSTPALSNAVLDQLTAGWQSIDDIEVVILPGNRAPRGLSVVAAILSYAGHPLRVFEGGRWRAHPGWGLAVRRRVGDLGPRWASLCDTPDLDILPQRFRPRRSALFRAGLELSVLHLGLTALSLLVRAKVVRSLLPAAPALRWAADWLLPFGSDRGAMEVRATGIDATGRRTRAVWTLVAESGDGPFVPTLPALAVIRALAEGRLHWRGAGACVGHLELGAIEAEMARYAIRTTIRTEMQDVPLFARALPGFADLPAAMQAAHNPAGRLTLHGLAYVTGATNPIGRLLARLFGFPHEGADVPVRVVMRETEAGEIWTRRFGRHRFRSYLAAGHSPGRMVERFGPFRFDLAVSTKAERLAMRVVGWRLGAVPLPRFLAPRIVATEGVDARGRFTFDVAITLFLIGRLVHYRGWLVPASVARDVESGPAPPAAQRSVARMRYSAKS